MVMWWSVHGSAKGDLQSSSHAEVTVRDAIVVHGCANRCSRVHELYVVVRVSCMDEVAMLVSGRVKRRSSRSVAVCGVMK